MKREKIIAWIENELQNLDESINVMMDMDESDEWGYSIAGDTIYAHAIAREGTLKEVLRLLKQDSSGREK